MKTKVINFVASPSSGKSLMAALVFSELKMMHFRAEYVQEYAKTLIWQDRLEELANQYNVSYEQYKMIKSVNGKVDYICLDSPLLLGLYYNKNHEDNVSDITKTEKMILSKMNEFENIYIFLDMNEEYPYENAGRIHNESQSKEIANELLCLLNDLGIKYKRFKSDRRNLDDILCYILNECV
jgi:hypothetical protein